VTYPLPSLPQVMNDLSNGSVVQETDMDALRLNIADLQARLEKGWSSYTPVWTTNPVPNPVVNNGSLTGEWIAYGKIITAAVRLKVGSTTTLGNGEWRFSLPFPAATVATPSGGGNYDVRWCGSWFGFHVNVANYGGSTLVKSAGTFMLLGMHGAGSHVASTAPITWDDDDFICAQVSYEAA